LGKHCARSKSASVKDPLMAQHSVATPAEEDLDRLPPLTSASPLSSWPAVEPPPAVPPASPRLRTVLHLINGEHFAGAERVQDLLAQELPSHGFDTVLVGLKPSRFGAARQSDAPLLDVGMANRFDLRAAWKVAQIAREHDAALLHAHTPRTLMIGAVASWRTGLPLVYHAHSPTICDSTRAWQNRVNHAVERWCGLRAVRWIAVSHSLGERLVAAGVPKEKVTVVPNGVAPLTDDPPQRARPTDWTLGTVALFRPRKGIEVLIEALAMLGPERPVRLLAVGPFETDAYERDVKRLVEDRRLADCIEWTGFCGDVTSQLHRMDAFVLPSLFGEGLPMVTLEAMAAGLPVVASNVEGVSEAVRHGHEGLLTQPGDAADLTARLDDLITGRYDAGAMGRLAWRRQRDHFSTQALAARVAGIYRHVLER